MFSEEFVMPNLQTSIKDLRQNKRKAVYNNRIRARIKKAIKKFDAQIIASDFKGAKETLTNASSILDKAAKKNIIKKNNASRKKSRLANKLNKTSAAQNAKTAKKSS